MPRVWLSAPIARLAFALVVLAAVPALAGDSPRRTSPGRVTFTVREATSPIRIDGELSEQAWRDAVVVPVDYEWVPGDNAVPPERTECLVTFDEERFYVAFRAWDRQPAAIRAHLADRDVPYLDDTVGFMIDTFDDQRRAYQFRINALGVQMDAVNSDVDLSEDWSWDGIWDAATRITGSGYEVEVAVPFASLRFARVEGPQAWGFVATRDLPRSTRHRMRSNFADRQRSCLICQFDRLEGIVAARPGLNLELDPTVTAARTDRRDTLPGGPMARGDLEPAAGLSARWGVTPNVVLGAAVNPDFYQVEADAAQLEINTRFALFYPEKRPFFLEGADFFGTPIDAVFTRTIADPSWGAKVTGKQGSHAFGLFTAQDEINNLVLPGPEGSLSTSIEQRVWTTVARYRRDLGRTSNVGVLYTGRESDGYHNRVAGVDGKFGLTRADSLTLQVLAATTAYPAATATAFGERTGAFSGSATTVSYLHNTRDWAWQAIYNDLSAAFRADAGFIPRVDTRGGVAAIQRSIWGKPGQWFTRLNARASMDYTEDHSGRVLDRGFDLPVEYVGPWQTTISVNPSFNREYFLGTTYDNPRTHVQVATQPHGDLRLGFSASAGHTIDVANNRRGELLSLAPTLEANLARHLSVTVGHTFQRVRRTSVPVFTANLSQVRAVYHLNARTFLRAILQYTNIERNPSSYSTAVDRRSQRLFTQWLFSYKVNPQTVFLLGYSDNALGSDRFDLVRSDRSLFVKLGYALVR